MAKLDLPYVKWRDGRPRFEPGPRERHIGFVAQDLRHDDGRWFSFEEAKTFADNKLLEIQAARAAGRKIRPAVAPSRTVEDLLCDWLRFFEKLVARGDKAASTLDGYRTCVNAILYKPESAAAMAQRQRAIKLGTEPRPRIREEFSLTPPAAIEAPEAHDFIDYLIDARGAHMGRACRVVLVSAFEFGRLSRDWRLQVNPAKGLKFAKPKGRVVIYRDDEIRQLVASADELGRPSIGDAILLGLLSGQRQGDRLALEDIGLDENNRRRFKQSKTGAIVAIPETPRLAQRLAEAKARVAAIKLAKGTRPATIIVSEATGLAYPGDSYRQVFEQVREHAARKMPSLAQKRDQDLRDTSVTWLARASATIPEVCSITGHDPKSVYTILTHYLAITPELADSAIGKLMEWMKDKGMAV